MLEEAATPETTENEVEFNVLVYSNQKHDAPAESLLRLFYEGAITNTIGVMRAKSVDTDEESLLIVGVNIKEDGKSDVFPLAKVLTHADAFAFKSPDGNGGWFDPNPIEPEVAEEA